MTPFKRRRRGGITATFEPNEATILASLAGQVVELLRDRNGESASDPDPLVDALSIGPGQPPEDPVLLRLLPDAYRDDPEDATEFRRFTEASLTSSKVENAQRMIDVLTVDVGDPVGEPIEVELDADTAQAWLRSLTDIRLSLAVRLGIETEEDQALLAASTDEAELAMLGVYEWLGWVQETLVSALS